MSSIALCKSSARASCGCRAIHPLTKSKRFFALIDNNTPCQHRHFAAYEDGHYRYRIEDAEDNVLVSFASLSDAERKLAQHDETWLVDAEEGGESMAP